MAAAPRRGLDRDELVRSMESQVNASKIFFAIFLIDQELKEPPIAFCGTGTVVARGVLLTCWHCVRTPAPEGHVYVACRREDDGRYVPHVMTAIEQHPEGLDLAMARVDVEAEERIVLYAGEPETAMPTWSYGYPHTSLTTDAAGRRQFNLGPRYLQGYIMRGFNHDQPGFRSTPSLELDMPTPDGLSGAGLFKHPTDQMIGLVYASHKVATIEAFERVDPETGEREPEIQQVVTFGLAHSVESLRDFAGTATGGRRLRELIPEAK